LPRTFASSEWQPPQYEQTIHDKETDEYPNCTDSPPKQDQYEVIVTQLDAVGNHGASLISRINQTSDFEFNFNAAWFPGAAPTIRTSSSTRTTESPNSQEGLIVRVVDFERHPEWVNAGALAAIPVSLQNHPPPSLAAHHVSEASITWAGAGAGPSTTGDQEWGFVDPRITYRKQQHTYYLTYDNCTKNCWPQRVTYLSTTTNPLDPKAWTFHGAVFPIAYSSGAALLFRDDKEKPQSTREEQNPATTNTHPTLPPHLAFVGNSNTADALLVAEARDGLHWIIPSDPSRRILMKGRPKCWDAAGIAPGPQPEKLSNGDYLLIYNIDTGFPYHKKNNTFLGRCAIGWAILDGTDPTQIVARATEPLIRATRDWETCPHGKDQTCQVPMVVFANGLKPLIGSSKHNKGAEDEFYVIYGGADSVVGVSKIKVNILRGHKTEAD